jgi:hypothetical protein
MDENLRGLLLELAEQPQRALLSTRVRRFNDLLRPDVEVLRPTTGMGVIEAKLLEAYREELARLLLTASRARHDSVQAAVLVPRDLIGRSHPIDQEALNNRVMSILSSTFAGAQPASAMEILRRVAEGHPMPLPSPTELAVASLRLVPKTETRIWLGVYAKMDGRVSRAIEIQQSAIADTTSGFLAAYAWSNIASASTQVGRHHDATEAGRMATIAEPAFGRGPLSWFLASIQAGIKSEALRSACAVTDALSEHSPELEEQVGFMKITRSIGIWSPTRESQQLRTTMGAGLSATAERIIEAFA